MTDLSQLFMYIPGIIIFLVGSGQVRGWFRTRRFGGCAEAEVVNCRHVVKKDKKDRELYNFYDVTIEYRDPVTGHRKRLAVKSPTEYAPAQQVRMYLEKGSEKPVLVESENEFLFHPWVTMTGGALLILLALAENQGKEIQAMSCLAIILAGAGTNLIVSYISLKKRGLRPLEAQITDIYTRQISRETKLLKGAKYTYYPIVRYELDGKENIRRCNINSSGPHTFKVGDSMTLYFDAQSRTVLEKHARTGAAVAGAVLLLTGILAGASILSVIL